LKLKSAHDCASMIEILKRRGMEFQQQRPHTSRLSNARLGTFGSQERPLTVQSSYSANRAFVAPPDPIKPSPIHMPVLEAGGLSSQCSQHFGNTASSFAFQRPQKQSLLQFPAHSTSLQEPIHSFTTHDTENSTPAPDLSRSNTAPFHRTMDNAATGYSDTSNQMHMTATATSSHGLDKPLNEHLSKASTLLSDQSNAQLETRDIASSSTENRNSLYRPSLPPSLRMPETLEHEMPPRRELPFKRPGSHQSSSSRPSTTSKSVYYNANGGSSDPPMVSSFSSPARKSDANRPATAASSVKSAAASKKSQPVEKPQAIHARPQSHASMLRKTSSGKTNAKVTKPAAPQSTFRRPSDLGELLRITKSLSERSPNSNKVSRMDSTADAAYELDTPPGTSSSLSKVNAQSMNHPSDSSITQAGAAEAASLANYASQSREDRQTVLDEFMISKLEDPNFAVLCEDLDTCWRKIALGL
jgi:hypothetical protein